MDWNNVTVTELAEGLKEVELGRPRPLTEFCFQLKNFGLPRSLDKWSGRVKNNVYYYRVNYVLLYVVAQLVVVVHRPAALVALAAVCVSLMCLNDPFATGFNDALLKVMKRLHSRTATRLRALVANNDSTLGLRRRGPGPRLFILWLPRTVFVLLGVLIGLLLMWRSAPARTLGYGLALGLGLPLLHASFRSPNLKARLTSAREEFRAVWRGYQAAAGQVGGPSMVNDYTQ
ncbi:hypothetical protein FOA52_007018 [Chlamydomonas sp. UWO 241]|nr:hypothetical protein FOA52_007018 [Chlamydomonas sp. UWO 241]